MKESKRTIVSVFGSSHPREGEPDYREAYELGARLAATGFVVCNGGYGGVMEASARGAKSARGVTIGVTCASFSGSTPNKWIDEVVETVTLVDRLQKLVALGDAYVVMKGGTGTLLELAAVWEFTTKGLMRSKPIVVLGAYWKPVIETLRVQLIHEGSIAAARAILEAESPQQCIEILRTRLT
ncbi:MAG: DNA-binding protein [Ignavibacteria bacterium]